VSYKIVTILESNLQNVSTTSQLEEFTLLFMVISSVVLTNQRDEIFWKWTKDDRYFLASAYKCQFLRAMTRFPATSLWQALEEPKCKFFAWLVSHDKVLTANNMIKRKWPCNPICLMCFCMQETTEHLLIECNYVETSWNLIASSFGLKTYMTSWYTRGPTQWVCFMLSSGKKTDERKIGYFVQVVCVERTK
jgi:hypothetical protein